MQERKNKIIILSLAAAVLFIAIFLLALRGLIISFFKKQALPSVEIGAILPFEGVNAGRSEALKKAAEFAFWEINENGGAKGRDFKIRWENGGCNETKAASAAEELMVRNHFKFILGGYCASETAGITALADKTESLVITLGAYDPKMDNDFIFSFAPRKGEEGAAAARYLREELQARRAVIITAISGYTNELSRVFKESFKAVGGEIATEEIFSVLNEDADKLIADLRDKNFDVIFMAVEIPAMADRYIAALSEAGIKAPVILPAVTLTENSVKEYKNLEGAHAVAPNILDTAYFQDFKNKYREFYGEDAPYAEEQEKTYLAVNLFAHVFKKYEFDTVKIKEYLSGLKTLPGAFGNLSFDDKGYAFYPYSVLKMENGELKELKIYKP